MSAQSIIEANITALESGTAILRQLSDNQYNRITSPYFSASVGKHFRHILDHYLSFVSGLAGNHINYDARARNTRIENNLSYALDVIEDIKRALKNLEHKTAAHMDQSNTVQVTLCTSVAGQTTPVTSSVYRELVFLQGHTTHHYAIIAAILRFADVEVDQAFGIAPSTLKYEAQTRCAQ